LPISKKRDKTEVEMVSGDLEIAGYFSKYKSAEFVFAKPATLF
jgi:hypothetical protein